MTNPNQNGWLGLALERHEAPLVRYAHRLLGDSELARDVVQDCFLRLCKQRRDRVEDHLKEWLFTVCRNRALDHLRKDGRMDFLGDSEIAAPAAEPSERLEQKEEEGRVLHSIQKLPPRQQEVLHLKFREGLSYKQISAICDLSVGNVGFLLHSAIKTLRERLGDQVSPVGRNS